MIPRNIHYVWVGGKPKPNKITKIMKSWSKLKGYTIIEWNETNIDINSNPFMKWAYDNKKYAFVSDYIRAYVIYHYGGIYLDTDVLILDSFDEFLAESAFTGFESEGIPFTAVFGAEKHHPFAKRILDYYNVELSNKKLNDLKQEDLVNTVFVTRFLVEEYECRLGDIEQVVEFEDKNLRIFKSDVLCNPSLNSRSIHVFTASWVTNVNRNIVNLRNVIRSNLTTKKRIKVYLFLKQFRRFLRLKNI